MSKRVCACLLLLSLGELWAANGYTQGQAAPDMIVFNGKIVTMSDKSFTSNVGTIAQAMAIKDDKIVAVGASAQIRGQAGPSTKQVDLKGRTVVPGQIVVHDHPYDWAPGNPYSIKKVLNDDLIVTRFISGPPQEQAKAFPAVLQEAVGKAKPGQWIYIQFSLGDKYEYGMDRGKYGNILDGKMIPLELIDQIAPNNQALLRDPFIGLQMNSKGMDEVEKVYPQQDMWLNRTTGMGGGGGPNGAVRWAFHEVLMRDHYKELREIHRLELSWWSGYGISAFSSRAYTPSNLKIYTDLSQSGEMDVRNMWTWGWRDTIFDSDPYLLNTMVLLEGIGNDYFWNGGGWGVQRVGSECTTLQPRIPVPSGGLNQCSYEPGSPNFNRLVAFVKAGGRISALHTGGDKDIDYLLEAIEKGSQEAGMTPEQIRTKRHTFDHLPLAPRLDQLPRIKRLGMDVGGAPFLLIERSPMVFKTYGEDALKMVVPKKTLVDAGIPNGMEIDRPLPSTSLTVFWTMARMIDRKTPVDGQVYAPDQRIGRELALKTTTTWGSHYFMKENQLGSLESGKFADFLVLDRDFLTIPENDIENIRVLGSVVGGKVRHLVPSLAREWGMQPKGAQIELGGAAAQW